MTNKPSITELLDARSKLDMIRAKIALTSRSLLRNPNNTDAAQELSVWFIAEDEAMLELDAVITAHQQNS